jgi:hypothetical protein
MPGSLATRTRDVFDWLERRWLRLSTQRRVASALVIVFAIALTWVYNHTTSAVQEQDADVVK